MAYYVYMLSCTKAGQPDKFYTGYTNDLKRRVSEHRRYAAEGIRKKYTGRFDSVRLVWYSSFEVRKDAMDEERRIKKINSAQKRKMAQGQP